MWTVYWNKKSDAVGKVVANRIVSISFSLASLTVDDTSQSTKIESRHFRNGNKLSSHGLGRVRARDIIKSNSTGTDYLKNVLLFVDVVDGDAVRVEGRKEPMLWVKFIFSSDVQIISNFNFPLCVKCACMHECENWYHNSRWYFLWNVYFGCSSRCVEGWSLSASVGKIFVLSSATNGMNCYQLSNFHSSLPRRTDIFSNNCPTFLRFFFTAENSKIILHLHLMSVTGGWSESLFFAAAALISNPSTWQRQNTW